LTRLLGIPRDERIPSMDPNLAETARSEQIQNTEYSTRTV
jgi:hypothetical protein